MKITPQNKNSIYAIIFFVLAFAAFSTNSFFASISDGLPPVNGFDWTMFKTFGVFHASSNALFFGPYILAMLFLASSAYFSIKAVRDRQPWYRGHMLPTISTVLSLSFLTLSTLFAIIVILLFVFD